MKLIKLSEDAINITKEQFNKTFDYAQVKSQTLKDKISYKIQERAVLNLKAELTMHNKTFEDYSDEELEILVSREKQKIIDYLKNKTLVAALAFLGLNFFIESKCLSK